MKKLNKFKYLFFKFKFLKLKLNKYFKIIFKLYDLVLLIFSLPNNYIPFLHDLYFNIIENN
jgi:hypothetical protein